MNITIFINDIETQVPQASSILQAAEIFAAKPPFALVLNNQFIARSEHETTMLHEHDRVDIISAIQGG